MAISRNATAHWTGDFKSGQGSLSTPRSGVLADTPYGFNTRIGDVKGTNPEELIAAAHAGCFTMALAARLTEAGHPPARLDTRAEVDLSLEGGPNLSDIRLSVTAVVPGLDAAKFQAIANDAKTNCPVSKALSAVPISLVATLEEN
jgi:osmotically inducible protein OsmC